MFPRLERRDGHVAVQMFGGHDEHGVHVAVGQQLAIIHVGGGLDAPHGFHASFGARDKALIGVADGGERDVIGRGVVQPLDGRVAARADADPAYVDLLIGPTRGDEGGTGGQRGRLQKIAAVDFIGHEWNLPME